MAKLNAASADVLPLRSDPNVSDIRFYPVASYDDIIKKYII